jgi:hypothetical protein
MKKEKTPSLQKLKEIISKLKGLKTNVELLEKSSHFLFEGDIFSDEVIDYLTSLETISELIEQREMEAVASIEMIEHPTQLTKPISEMSYEELLAHNDKATALQAKRKSALPDNLVPQPTPLEQFLAQVSKRSGDIGKDNANYNATVNAASSLLFAISTLSPEEKEKLNEAFNSIPIPNTVVDVDIVVENKT